ncbi:MAG: twin-arginine translocase subunit TatC [Alphaproteobacteria bacterium]|nr:twin-arginine translocase subunit TatC [Alphaproteobacteria bacterium]
MKKMTMMQHFSELRRRILWTFLIFVCALVFGWCVAPVVQDFLTAPLINVWPDGALLYSGLTDGLMIQLSLAFVVALMIIIPVALWHIWAYVSPGLKKKEQRFIFPILVLSPILFVLGAGFAFYVLMPFVFRFFIELNESAPVPSLILPVARDYLSFAIGLLKVFGLAFQLPLILVMLNRLGVLPRKYAVKMRRYAIVIIVIAAAVLTPPDVVSQILLAVPLWALFEVSILFMKHD